jgi:hypothetical protein
MTELTFGRPKSYPKIVTPEIEAKREVERNKFREDLTPGQVQLYNNAIVPAPEEDLRVMSTASVEIVRSIEPGLSEIAIRNGMLMAKVELEIRQRNPVV